MKFVKILSQNRRDTEILLECEDCGNQVECSGYDDRNFYDNVIPTFKCKKCGKSSKDLGISNEMIQTKYPAGLQL